MQVPDPANVDAARLIRRGRLLLATGQSAFYEDIPSNSPLPTGRRSCTCRCCSVRSATTYRAAEARVRGGRVAHASGRWRRRSTTVAAWGPSPGSSATRSALARSISRSSAALVRARSARRRLRGPTGSGCPDGGRRVAGPAVRQRRRRRVRAGVPAVSPASGARARAGRLRSHSSRQRHAGAGVRRLRTRQARRGVLRDAGGGGAPVAASRRARARRSLAAMMTRVIDRLIAARCSWHAIQAMNRGAR